MNSRERFQAMMRFEKPDQPFFTEFMMFWPETMDRWLKEGYPAGVNPEEYFGFDHFEAVPIDFNFVPAFEVEVLEETDEYQIVRDPTGVLKKEFKYGSAMPHYIDFPIKTRNDFEALKERLDPRSPERYPANWPDLVERYRNRDFPIYLVCRGLFAFERDFMDFNELMIASAMEPEWIEDMVTFHTDFVIGLWEKALSEIEVDYVYLGEDMAYKNGPMISPRSVRELMLPHYKRLIGFLKDNGVEHIFVDSDGDVRSLVEIYVEAGATGILPLEVAANMNPLEIRQQYPRLQMVGGLNKLKIAQSTSEMEQEVSSKVLPLVKSGGYLPSFDHSVPPIISLADYKHYLDFLRETEAQALREM